MVSSGGALRTSLPRFRFGPFPVLASRSFRNDPRVVGYLLHELGNIDHGSRFDHSTAGLRHSLAASSPEDQISGLFSIGYWL